VRVELTVLVTAPASTRTCLSMTAATLTLISSGPNFGKAIKFAATKVLPFNSFRISRVSKIPMISSASTSCAGLADELRLSACSERVRTQRRLEPLEHDVLDWHVEREYCTAQCVGIWFVAIEANIYNSFTIRSEPEARTVHWGPAEPVEPSMSIEFSRYVGHRATPHTRTAHARRPVSRFNDTCTDIRGELKAKLDNIYIYNCVFVLCMHACYTHVCVWQRSYMFWFYTCELSTLVTCFAFWSTMHMTKEEWTIDHCCSTVDTSSWRSLCSAVSIYDPYPIRSTTAWKMCIFVKKHKEIFDCSNF